MPKTCAADQQGSESSSLLDEIRKEFRICCSSTRNESSVFSIRSKQAVQTVTAESLARRWLQLVETDRARRGLGPPGALDEQAVALRMTQLLRELDISGRGVVHEEEWVHGIHLLSSDRLAEQIRPLLRISLASRPQTLAELHGLFEQADSAGSGRLSIKQVSELYSSGVFRISPESTEGHMLNDEEVRSYGPERLARELVEVMDVDCDARVSYAEFVAFCVGRRRTPVYLYMYDLSKGLATLLAPWILGPGLDCIWHSGLVVFDKEYFFAKDAVWDNPGKTDFGVPTKEVFLGYTVWTKSELHAFICNELKPVFHRDTYDAIGNNCNHFADRLSLWLTGKHLPDEVLLQTERLMNIVAVRAIRPALNRLLRDHVAARSTPNPADEESLAKGQNRSADGPSQLQPWHPQRGVRMPIGPSEEVSVGTVVSVQPSWGRGAGALGMVCEQPVSELTGMRSGLRIVAECGSWHGALGFCCRPSEQPHPCGAAEAEQQRERDPSLVWVRYFELTPPDSVGAGWSGRVCLEALPRDRLLRVKPEDSVKRPTYLAAIAAISSAALTPMHRSSPLLRQCDDEALLQPPSRMGLPQQTRGASLSPLTAPKLLPEPHGSRRRSGSGFCSGSSVNGGLEGMRPRSHRESPEYNLESLTSSRRQGADGLEDDSLRLA